MSIDPADYWMTPDEERRLEDKLTNIMKEETKIWVISVDEDPMPWEYWDLPHSVFIGTEEEAESYRLGLEANNPKEWLWSIVSTQVNTIQSNGKAIL